MTTDDRGNVILSSGRLLGVNQGIFGLGPDLMLCDGYDGHAETFDDEHQAADGCRSLPFTVEERAEIADEMISRWTRFWAGEGETS